MTKASMFPIILILTLPMVTHGLLFNDFQGEDIKRVARLVMDCGQIPGMSVVVVRGSETWTLPLGVANKTSQDPVKDSTKFVIASLTKAFTSTLLLMLLKESKEGYTMDTTLKDILKEDLFPDPERSNEATVKDILSHRMGLARADLALFSGYPDEFSLQDLSSAISCLPVLAPFRDGFIYSNFMYSLAGHVIETLANQTYAEALRSRILEPLGMTSTLTQYSFNDPQDSMAQPYILVDGKVMPADHSLFRLPVFLPALGLATNAPDMARWLQTLLQLGVSPSGRQVIPPEVIAMTQYPITPCIVNQLRPRFTQPELTFAYGMGWFQSTYKGFRRIWHAGTLYGFTSVTWLFPDMGIAVLATTNGPARPRDTKSQIKTLLSYIVDPLLGFPPWLDQSNACMHSTFQNQQHSFTSFGNNNNAGGGQKVIKKNISCNVFNESYRHSIEDLEKYTGFYYNKLFGKVYVELVDKHKISNQTILKQKCPNVEFYGQRLGKILRATFGERFSGILHATADKNFFQMEPTGIFEFSTYAEGDKDSTMPVEFSMEEDGMDNVAYKVKAVWQATDMIHFNRHPSEGKCYEDISSLTSGGNALGEFMSSLQLTFHLYILIKLFV